VSKPGVFEPPALALEFKCKEITVGRHRMRTKMPKPEVIAAMSRQQIINLRRDLLASHHDLCSNGKCKCELKTKKLPPIPR
jgi:hypothetical protein